ncbi:MAG: heme o synthase [Pseudomonadales bacterium]|nr:heme o synthase [Pseudomonadales bacterium]NRA18741.1 protoheme IX farnesyltransferase [Oceanospirillaceae bacterium]
MLKQNLSTVSPLNTELRIADFLALCKLKVVAVMLITSLVGMLLASELVPSLSTMLIGLLGIGLVTSSGAAINHVMDQKIDQAMARTQWRPLPQGKVSSQQALIFALAIGAIGLYLLAAFINPLTAWLTLFSLVGYAVVYTVWLKRATPQNIVVGGIAGAAPPLLGWTAVSGEVTANSLLLVLIIFAWTPPHFWALCLARKKDYAKADIPMLPITHGERYTKLHIVLYSVIMVLTTILPFLTGMAGLLYLILVSGLNIRFLQWSYRVYKDVKNSQMDMFRYSISYLMLLFAALLADHYFYQLIINT